MSSFKMFFVAAILCYATESIWAQEAQGDPYQYNPSDKMFLPTPEQASLLKFTNIPAGNHTGVFGYSVPIYTIQGKEFSLPISIDYHGMGIKVNETSGSVGIGWALNIGGISLSQEVRGERDQNINRLDDYFNPDYFQPEYSPMPNQAYIDAVDMLGMGSWAGHPTKELNPDYFSYSLLNNSGRFMLDNDNKAHTIPKDNVKIQGIGPFILTDSKGLVYHFSSYLQENATYGAGSNGNGGIVQNRENYGYKIDYIEIPHSGEIIQFTYHQVKYSYVSSHTVRNKVNYSPSGGFTTMPANSNTMGVVTEYLPASIIYNRTKVEFNYKRDGTNPSKFLDREDVDNVYDNVIIGDAGGILEYIEVSDISNNSKSKQYKLLTDYFISQNEALPDMGTDQTTWRKRLKLEEIQELISETAYEFEYYGESEGKVLPPRFSYKTDYWGMYNGKINTTELNDYVISGSDRTDYFPGADKMPDINFAKIGSLKKVKLPTGGSQVFEYELDEYNNRRFEDDDDVFPVYEYEQRGSILFDQSFLYTSTTYNDYDININLPLPDYRAGIDQMIFFSTSDPPENIDEPGDMPDEQYFVVKLFEVGNPTPLRETFMNGDLLLPQLDPQKNYYIKLKREGSDRAGAQNPNQLDILIALKWVDEVVTYPQNRNAGTLRAKSITLNDVAGNPQIKRSYAYKDFEDPTRTLSSGKFTGRPLTRHYNTREPDPEAGYIDYINITNNDIYNLSHTFGKSVVYEHVTETYESTDAAQSAENHKKEYIFSWPFDVGSGSNQPTAPDPHIEYQMGQLLEERIFNSESDTVKITKYEYEEDGFFNQFSANKYSVPSALSTALILSTSSKVGSHYLFNVNYYDIVSAWIKLLKTTVDEYENGTRVRTNTTEYTYNEGTGASNEFKSILPVSVTTGTSMATDNGSYAEKIKTVYKYPQDLIGGTQGSLMQALKDANRISEPVKTEKFKIKSGTETQLSELYMKYGANLLPSEVHFRSDLGDIDLNSITDRKVRYSRYDANGNIEEFIMEDGTPVSIVWGYNKQFPIAKVEGVPYSVVETYITNIVNDSNGDTTNCIGLSGCNEATLRVSLNTFRKQTAFSDALITTYTYDPLLGVTSITQPNGQVEYYKYDSAGRLELIHDKDLNVLKNMRYNYKD